MGPLFRGKIFCVTVPLNSQDDTSQLKPVNMYSATAIQVDWTQTLVQKYAFWIIKVIFVKLMALIGFNQRLNINVENCLF